MKYRVCIYGEPVLKEKGAKITQFDAALKQLVADMLETMNIEEGMGLAAPQIGKSIQLAVVDMTVLRDKTITFKAILDGKHVPKDILCPLALVNPVIEVVDHEEWEMGEGCLSLPGVHAKVIRPHGIKINYQDVEGTHHVLECDGILARCAQHEVDHLNGILIIDRAGAAEKARFESKLKIMKREARDLLKQQAKDAKGIRNIGAE